MFWMVNIKMLRLDNIYPFYRIHGNLQNTNTSHAETLDSKIQEHGESFTALHAWRSSRSDANPWLASI